MIFKRHVEDQLRKWMVGAKRKPLILRGARQVGKTTLVKKIAKEYRHSILLNLEKPADIQYFQNYDDVETIVNALFLSQNIPTSEKSNTLIFIDEIQESPKAIGLLRYFYEDEPEINVIAAGSLFEHAMRKVKSFPVGRVEYLYLHPLNFLEYLRAMGNESALEQINMIPVNSFAHNILMNLFNRYAIIGGMPEVVEQQLQTDNLADLLRIYESIWGTYKDDIEKYAANRTETRVINHIMNVAHLYIDQRIKFQNFGNSNYRSREVGEAMRSLDDAKVIQLIYPATSVEAPIKIDVKKSPRLQFLDTGLINHALGIQVDLLAMKDLSTAYKGALIPHLMTQELISLNKESYKKPNFWVREKTQSSAEVDLLYAHHDKIIPIEIKSGKAGKLKSLHQFIEMANHSFAIRIYAGEFSVEQHKTPNGMPYLLMNLPYYLGSKIPEYTEYFVENYKM